MARSVSLSNNLVKEASIEAKKSCRSIAQQIEYWVLLGRRWEQTEKSFNKQPDPTNSMARELSDTVKGMLGIKD